MRVFLAMMLVGLMLAPQAGATPRVFLVEMYEDSTALLTWEPRPSVAVYYVYRGTSLQDLELIGVTTMPAFLDDRASKTTPFYLVTYSDSSGTGEVGKQNTSSGSCIRTYDRGFSINLENCISH